MVLLQKLLVYDRPFTYGLIIFSLCGNFTMVFFGDIVSFDIVISFLITSFCFQAWIKFKLIKIGKFIQMPFEEGRSSSPKQSKALCYYFNINIKMPSFQYFIKAKFCIIKIYPLRVFFLMNVFYCLSIIAVTVHIFNT